MSDEVEREAMDYDVVVVGAGPAGLAAAIRLKQLAADAGSEFSVAVVEKGSEVGAHILSGAVVDPIGLTELIPDWKEKGAPLDTPVTEEKWLVLGPQGEVAAPLFLMPPFMHNRGCYAGSLANLCRWLGTQAEALGVEIYPGMAASDLTYRPDGSVKGVVAGVFGIGKNGERKPDYQPGVELNGKYVFIAEGVRGSLAKVIQAKYDLAKGREPQKFGIGIKEIWQVPDAVFKPGFVQHTVGWPMKGPNQGGGFLYHFGDHYVSVGFVTHLNYKNPWLSPFDEFQRYKHHPAVRASLEGGKRIAYGARAVTEGGWQSIPKLAFPGGVLIGCSAGFLNVARLKGSHNAIKSGMLAAEAAFAAIVDGRSGDELGDFEPALKRSWVGRELRLVRNGKPLLTRYGAEIGGFLGMIDMWTTYFTGGFSFLGTLKHGKTDAASTGLAKDYKPIVYPKPDGVLSFDKNSSVFLSSTNHDEDQPAHLRLKDPSIPIDANLPKYGEPARLYCPAGVYEVLYDDAGKNPRFQINAQNCVHCKTCDIKDPAQNITWTCPEGGGGPNYPNM
jgi:electron-transferring-flavoprotein dehydrogenase